MKSEKQIEKEYAELQKQKEKKQKEKQKLKAVKEKETASKFKKVFSEKYKGRCFYGVLTDFSRSYEVITLLGKDGNDKIKVFYRLEAFEQQKWSTYFYFDAIYECKGNLIYRTNVAFDYSSIKEFVDSISALEKHQKVLSEMYIENNFDNIQEEMYEKTKNGYRFGSDTVQKFFSQFKHLRCEVDKREFIQILEKQIKD